MVRNIFKGRVIAAAGPLPGQLTVENLTRWTKLRSGIFVTILDETVTHLLCTEEQFRRRKKYPHVQRALKERKKLHVLHYDWYEFSCTDNKKLPESEYSMRDVLAKEKAKQREKERIERGKREGEKFVNTNFFHVYFDREMFPYQITLTREGEDGETERYEMTIWESHAKPHLYQFTAKYLKRKGCSQPSYYRPSPCSRKWRPEMDLFMDFFRIKTGVVWEDRVMLQKTMGAEYFQYIPPRGGKPVGRRLRLPYEECLEINARERGLPWPPIEEEPKTSEDQKDEDQADAEDDEGIDMTQGTVNEETSAERMESNNAKKPDVDLHMDNDDGKDVEKDVEMDDVDSGVSVNDSDHESDDQDPETPPSGGEAEEEPEEWNETVNFIKNMNETFALAKERILRADDAILDARDALPGFLKAYLKYY